MTNKSLKRSSEAGAKKTKGKHSINRYFYSKTWDTSFRLYSLDPAVVAHRLENNLPIDDLYDRLDEKYKRQNPKEPITHKICSRCHTEKPVEDYYKVNAYYQPYCKKCQSKSNGN